MTATTNHEHLAIAAEQPIFLFDKERVEQLDGHAVPYAENAELDKFFSGLVDDLGIHKLLIVSGKRFETYPLGHYLQNIGVEYERFSSFSPNPTYEQIVDGVNLFRTRKCDSLLSVGGGSAIDVAKCIQAYAPLNGNGANRGFLYKAFHDDLPCHIAVPTTAGTGSESTHFAVMYVDGEKQSVASHSLLPTVAILDPNLLEGLPEYQKKATMLDALCQAIESHWSRRSCAKSRRYSAFAIPTIMKHWSSYLSGDITAAKEIMLAANCSGKAINITTTTAPHAFSYKLTSLYGIPHGHAVGMCMPKLWQLLIEKGGDPVQTKLSEIAFLMSGSSNPSSGLTAFSSLYNSLMQDSEHIINKTDLPLLVASVNQQRLTNFPLELSKEEIRAVYNSLIDIG